MGVEGVAPGSQKEGTSNGLSAKGAKLVLLSIDPTDRGVKQGCVPINKQIRAQYVY